MKRLLAVMLALSIAACGSQQRPADEPDFSTGPNAPDESPEKPRLGEIESLISQAKLEIKRRDFDEARVKLFQVFRRDRWNPEANTLYQDLEISRGKGDALYQEYLDLYEANKQRGDALWFHLRPLLIKRGIKACEVEKHEELTEEQKLRIAEIDELPAPEGAEAERKAEMLKRIDEILVLNPMDGEWVARRAYIDPETTVKRYRTAAEENPGSGDTVYLLAMSLFGASDSAGALDVLRQAWILELPGAYLCLGLAQLSLIHPATPATAQDEIRIRRGMLEIEYHFSRIFDATVPGSQRAGKVVEEAKRAGIELEDLSQRR